MIWNPQTSTKPCNRPHQQLLSRGHSINGAKEKRALAQEDLYILLLGAASEVHERNPRKMAVDDPDELAASVIHLETTNLEIQQEIKEILEKNVTAFH